MTKHKKKYHSNIIIIQFLFVVLLNLLILNSISCQCEINNESNDMDMYKTYVLSDDILHDAGLPIVKIQTENNKYILSKKNWVSAKIDIISDQYTWNITKQDILIRIRGNTTATAKKRPYAIQFFGKTSVCGMPKQEYWNLIANHSDNSFIKNEMAFYLSRQVEMDYTVKGQYVNLVLNGNYVGLY